MYKLILVDDESEIRQGLKEVVPFEELGFTVVGEAGNGVEALRLCEELRPDILITDIRMPLMDGLTLCRRVREALHTVQFIILSGYDDFEYARQAIEVKTMGYLLKPISSGEFVAMLKDAKRTLDEEFAKRRDVVRLKEHFRESLPLLREMLLGSLLGGGVTAAEAMGKADKYEMNLSAQGYAVALIRMGDCANSGIEDASLCVFAVRNILCEVLDETAAQCCTQVFMYNGMLAVLLLLKQNTEEAFAAAISHLSDARKTVRHFLECPLYVGVSAVYPHAEALPLAARQAQNALEQCAMSAEEQVLCITDIERDTEAAFLPDERLLRKLSTSISVDDRAQAETALMELLEACKATGAAFSANRVYFMELFMCFVRTAPELPADTGELYERYERARNCIFRECPTPEEVELVLKDLLGVVLGAVDSRRRTSGHLLAREAESYLNQNYAIEDLSLETLCLHLHISPSYFSALFKRETKKTFHQYLTDLRMNSALRLLGETEMKTAEIARQVGLPDPSYFSYCFKKHFGFPPSKARKKAE
ncbi:MAG: response regulator [Clostridia bacterium]